MEIDKGSLTLDLSMKTLFRIPDAAFRELKEVKGVKVLNLSQNKLKRLPANTNKLTNLTTLNLSHNKFAKLPDAVTELINLIHLYVNDNQLAYLPKSMKHLENLRELDLRNNKLERLGIDISDLKQLEELSVEGNPLTLEAMRSLTELRNKKPGKISMDIAGENETWPVVPLRNVA